MQGYRSSPVPCENWDHKLLLAPRPKGDPGTSEADPPHGLPAKAATLRAQVRSQLIWERGKRGNHLSYHFIPHYNGTSRPPGGPTYSSHAPHASHAYFFTHGRAGRHACRRPSNLFSPLQSSARDHCISMTTAVVLSRPARSRLAPTRRRAGGRLESRASGWRRSSKICES